MINIVEEFATKVFALSFPRFWIKKNVTVISVLTNIEILPIAVETAIVDDTRYR
jgi:hypothetical protein